MMLNKNKIITIMIISILVGCLFLIRCNKQPSPPLKNNDIDEPVCEKDGIISLAIVEDVFMSEDSSYTLPVDTLFISEVDDSVWIENALQFSLPQSQAFTMFFTGDLQDMPNYAVIWYKYYETIKGEEVPSTELTLLGLNHGTSLFSSVDTEYSEQDSIIGFAFFIDFDTIHHGAGQLILESTDFSDTLMLESQKHTVTLKPQIKTINFQVTEYTTSLHITCHDKDSFVNLKHDAIWLMQYQNQKDSFIAYSTSRTDMGVLTESPEREFTILGFTPNFISE